MASLNPSATTPAETDWQPHVPAARAQLPKIPAGSPWLYAHYPHRWMIEQGEIVPDLTTVSLEPGANNAGKEVPGGGGLPDGAILAMQRRGAKVFIDTMLPALGASYVKRVRTEGGHVWLDYAADAIPGTAQVRIDPERRIAVLRALRDQVAPPAPHVIEAIIERTERDHAAAFAEADRNPLQAREAERLAAELKIWRAALEPDAEPESHQPRRRRKASEPEE